MNDKQTRYLGAIQKKRESDNVNQKTAMEVSGLFSYNPVKSSWWGEKLSRSLLDMPAIPNSISDDKIIKKIASLLSERVIKSITDPTAPTTGESRKWKTLQEYKNPNLVKIDGKVLLSKSGIDGFNKQINEAIQGREHLRAKKIPEDLRRNVPKNGSGKIHFTNTQEIIDFIRKKHLSPETYTSSKIIEYKHITCHLLKEMIVQENYEQFKGDIDRATQVFENYALEEFIYFFTFVDPNQKIPSTIEELQGIQLKITVEQMEKEGIKYNKDIKFGLATRPKVADSIKKKTRGNLDQSSADQLMDIGGFRQTGLKTDAEGKKQAHIIQYYLQKKMNRVSYINNKHITSKIPYTLEEIQKLGYSLTKKEIELVVSELDSIIKSKGTLFSKLLNSHQSNRPDIHELDYAILNELGLTDPIVIRQMELEIERTNKAREEMFYIKQDNRLEAKKKLLKEMKPKENIGVDAQQKEFEDIIFWYINNHNSLGSKKTKYPKIEGTQDMIMELGETEIKFNYRNKKGGQEEIILPKDKVNEFAKLRLEKRKEKEGQGKGDSKIVGTRTKNGQISDLKSGRNVYTQHGEYFKCEIQTYLEDGETDPYSDDLVYQIMKDISPHAERDVFITKTDIENYIKKKIIEPLSKSIKGQNILERIKQDTNNNYVQNHNATLREKLYEYIINKFGLEYNEKFDIYQIKEQKLRIEKMASRKD